MANQPNPRKFSEKIALLNQKQAEETRAFEAIMREVSDVTSRVAGVASSGNSLVASPIESGSGDGEGSVKSAGASPPQTSGKHLRINLGNQFKAGGSLPNVNNNNDHTRSVPGMTVEPATVSTISSTVRCANSVTVTNHNNHHRRRHRHTNTTDCRRRENETTFPASIYSVDPKTTTTTNNVEELQNHTSMYRTADRGRSVPGPMRSRPTEKRHEMPRYSGVPYLSPPPPDTWRRTNSDSALHQSANESCQMLSSIPHRRGSDAYPHASAGMVGSEHRDLHRSFMERPRSSCEMPRVPDISIYPSSQPPGQQIPIGNNTGSLPDLSNVHFPSPLPAPLDQEEHSSSTQYSNSPQTSSPTTLSPTSLQQAGRLSFSQEPGSAHVQNHLSVPVNSRFLHTCKGVTLENSTSTSQQDLHSYTQPPPPPHSPQHFIYHQPSSPLPPQSPNTSHSHQTATSLGSYRTPQPVNRPSPQSSPSLTVRGSPLSYSNNPSAPPSPTGHLAQPNFTPSNIDQNNHIPDQTQAATLQQHFEQFSMDWAQLVQQLVESGCTWTSQPQPEMDSPVAPTTLSTYISSPSHTANYTQSEMINVGGESGSGDAGYFSTSPQLAYQPRTPTSTQQLTPQTPNTPSIILTDFSGNLGLTSSEFMKDFHSTEMPSDLSDDLFPADDDFRQSLGPMDFASLQMLSDPDLPITDEAVEDHFRLSNF